MKKNEFSDLTGEKILIFDGAMGTELQRRGYLNRVRFPEELNLLFPELVAEIHRDYLQAGCEVILTNTFGANRLKLASFNEEKNVGLLNQKGTEIARKISRKFPNILVAGDVGPLGQYLQPLGSLNFSTAYEVFSEQIQSLARAGVDLLVIETISEIKELKAALLAAQDNFSGPVIAQMTFTQEGVTVTGTDVFSFLALAESLGADAIGINCSVGPGAMLPLVKKIVANTNRPVSFKPNAGIPQLIERQTVFPGTPEEFLQATTEAVASGVNIVGGCCGTNPDFIRRISDKFRNVRPLSRPKVNRLWLSSRQKAIDLNSFNRLVIVGERINPTNRQRLAEDIVSQTFTVCREEARKQVEEGADILDINLGLPRVDEKVVLPGAVEKIQEAVAVPLSLDTSDISALEAALPVVAGRPLINSVDGKKERLEKIIPLAKRFGALLVTLTTDERGIPENSQQRLKIAEKIIAAASQYGYPAENLIFDFVVMSVGSAPRQIPEVLKTLTEFKKKYLRNKTILGISNVSFGLPYRQMINSTFLKIASQSGLDLAIVNPGSDWNLYSPRAEKLLLTGKSEDYLAEYSGFSPAPPKPEKTIKPEEQLYQNIIRGNPQDLKEIVNKLIELGKKPLEIVDEIILKALSEVGELFRDKKFFLPQVMASAEVAQKVFALVRPSLQQQKQFPDKKIILATVKGDVHDIGKNIVATVLESYGWTVLDLGKDVSANEIIAAARKNNIRFIGLSALMTTTMPEMEKIVQLARQEKLAVRIIIGGAPVTEDFARDIGADGYARDGLAAANLLQKLLNDE